ncbi:hypothetical protein [Bacillus sp. MUM 13]|uniref:hypothetical protein n=1 Tax=Bacillus sp. MUM 13 TaxID=1678001 RepID=UPI0008F58F02|nr:hypothetical protein [Bacillus sp. MUM 13]OIK11312.1 hypothetical protein BIV59_12590 [Bacillus sp. MUM 13]
MYQVENVQGESLKQGSTIYIRGKYGEEPANLMIDEREKVVIGLWDKINKLKGKTLYTVGQQKQFEIIEVNDNKCVIKVGSTGKIRPITKKEFERANMLGPISSLNTSILRQKGASEVNPAYVLSILRAI